MKIVSRICLIAVSALLLSSGTLSAKCKDSTCAQKRAKQQEAQMAAAPSEEIVVAQEVVEAEALCNSEEIAENISADEETLLEDQLDSQEAVR